MTTTITLDDPELAAIVARIVRAIPNARVSSSALPPRALLSLYAELLEQGAIVTLLTSHEPITDPELD